MNEEIKSNYSKSHYSNNFQGINGITGSNPFSQHSKVTSIIKRRTKDLDEDDDELGYSQSSQTYQGQLDGFIQTQQQDQVKQHGIGNSTIDMNFLSDINNECNYLITKFQQEQYVSQRIANNNEKLRRKSSDMLYHQSSQKKNSNMNPGVDEGERVGITKVLQQDKSNKTVGDIIMGSKTTVAPPLTGKNQRGLLNQQFMTNDDLNSQSNVNTIIINQAKFNSAAMSNSNISNKMKTGMATTIYDNKSLTPIGGLLFQENQQSMQEQSNSQSLLVKDTDRKMYEEGSQKYVSSYYNKENSKYSISNTDQNSSKGGNQGAPVAGQSNIVSFRDDKMTFRGPEKESAHFKEYLLPQDSVEQKLDAEPPHIQTHEDASDDGAQYDLQNFNAFNGKIEGVSVNTSKDENYFEELRQFQKYELAISNMNIQKQGSMPKSPAQNFQQNQQDQQFSDNKGRYELDNDDNYEDDHEEEENEDNQQEQQQQTHSDKKALQQLNNITQSPVQSNNTYNISPDQPITDDLIYNRLPKNFFVQEDEGKDLDLVLSSITKMRQDFLGYMNETNFQQKLDEISNVIIQPEKFIQKHLDQPPEEVLFEQVISERALRKDKEKSKRFLNNDDEEPKIPEDKEQSKLSARAIINEEITNIGNVETIKERMKNTIYEEDLESSPDQLAYQEQKNSESARQQLRIKSAKTIIKPQDSSVYSVTSSTYQQARLQNPFPAQPRILKMADYFKAPVSPSDAGQSPSQQQQQNLSQMQDDQMSLSESQKAILRQKMEQDILKNLKDDINFLFNRGDNLRQALIDPEKVYKIMQKIKEIANQKIEQGAALREEGIDYNEVVRFLKQEEIVEQEKLKNGFINQNPNIQPLKPYMPLKMPQPDEQWTQVVDFMRKNPKLLLQMLPDNSDEENQEKNDPGHGYASEPANKGKNKLMQQIEEAKRWQKLQALSKNFLDKKDLIDAMDNNTILNRLNSPSKSTVSKDKKYFSSNKNKNQGKAVLNNNSSNMIQSDNEAAKQSKAQSNQPSRSLLYQKQFQYNSVGVAKQIYNNPPFIQSDDQQQQEASQGVPNQQNRQIKSQQQKTRSVKKSKVSSGAGDMSTLGMNPNNLPGDATTLGTTATGHITHLQNYNNQNLLGSQNLTLDNDQPYYQQNNGGGVMSMLSNYNYQDKNFQNAAAGGNSHRRPTTASAAVQNNTNNRSLAFMRPILQQRQESFDANSAKVGKFKRGTSLIKNINKGSNVEYNSTLNQSAINNYENNQLDISYNLSGGLNQSFAGQPMVGRSGIIGPNFAPISLGPSRKTQKYIEKIAPSLKENELYPKFINRARKATNGSNISNAFHQQRLPSSDSAQSSQQMNLLQNRKKFIDPKRASEKLLNQSVNNLDKDQAINSEYEQKPQGVFPKFVKRQITSQSNSSRKESTAVNTSQPFLNSQLQQNKKMVNQTMQTRIGGIQHKLLISPQNGLVTDPFYHEISRQDSQTSDKFSKKHLKIPIVDWAFTQIFQKTLANDTVFNKQYTFFLKLIYRDQDMSIYLEKEIDYVIDMMKNKYRDFKKSDIMRPFFLKAQQTLQALLSEQGLTAIYENMNKKYKEITIENTMKLLIRCKLSFHARDMIINLLNSLISYELIAVQLKEIIDKHGRYQVSKQDYDEIQAAGNKIFHEGHQLLLKIKALRSVHKQFKAPFIFKKKDYVNYVKSEMLEVKKLISIFKIQKEGETADDDQNDVEKLKQIEENKNETEEQSYYSSENRQEEDNLNE